MRSFKIIIYILSVPLITLFSSCIYKKHFISSNTINESYVPVCIQMPQNKFVFENVAPIVYEEITNHFNRAGLKLANHSCQGYTIKIKINKLSPTYKYVSPDLLLCHSFIKIELDCKLYNFVGKMISQKTFFFSTLISKPRNPIINSSFLDFQYRKLMKKSAPKIEHYFRPMLKNNEK